MKSTFKTTLIIAGIALFGCPVHRVRLIVILKSRHYRPLPAPQRRHPLLRSRRPRPLLRHRLWSSNSPRPRSRRREPQAPMPAQAAPRLVATACSVQQE